MHDVLKDMQVDLGTRDLKPNTVAAYLRYAGRFVREIGKPLEELDRDDVRQYLLRLREQGQRAPTRNMVLAAVRFLFCTTLRRPEVVAGIRRARTQPTVPIILSGNEMALLLASLRSVTYRAMVATLYGTGLRVSEMCALRIEDIDSKRMQLRIPQGKTGQRYARLTPAVLEQLRAYYRQRQALAAQRWLDQRLDRLLLTHYFHVTFTLPAELRAFARGHPQLVYDLLFQAAASTLLELGRDPRWLGAQLGITAVLHTWSRKLHWHPHLHCVVSGGGLSLDQQRWLSAPPTFLFPVKVAGALFRGKFLDALRNRLDPVLRDHLYRCRWIVDCRPPFGSAEHVLRYLGRYTHRVGISNHRLLRISDGTVTFRTRHRQSETCSAVEFLRRFLGHVLPRGFVRIRHYGLLASRNVPTRLAQAQRCVLAGKTFTPRRLRRRPADWRSWYRQHTGVHLRRCPRCGHRDVDCRPLPRARPPPRVQVTS